MRVPQILRNVILEVERDIVVPAHTEVGKRIVLNGNEIAPLPRPVPEQTVRRWRLISNGDLLLDLLNDSGVSGAAVTVQWTGKLELSYYLSGPAVFARGPGPVIAELQGSIGAVMYPPASGGRGQAMWFARPGSPGGWPLLPNFAPVPDTMPMAWHSDLPVISSAPQLVFYSSGLLGGLWAN
jgi:hypothetical protein